MPGERLSWKVCFGSALLALIGVLLALPDHAATGQSLPAPSLVVPADSDSVAALAGGPAAAAPADSDSVAVRDSFPRVERYLPSYRPRRWTASPVPAQHPFMPHVGGVWERDIVFDDSTGRYVVYEQVNGYDVRFPRAYDEEAYRQMRLRAGVASNWERAITERKRQRARAERRGGLGVNITVPGGRNSAFTTIFGKPQVDLRVNGQAAITAGFNRQQSDQQSAFSGGDGIQWDPQFNQTMNLGITGTIGDKLHVNVDWDTDSQFDYQNQLKLDYKGYEDDIVQSVEAGNVYLKTPSTLIQGGQKLFGIKSQFQLGPVNLTAVASQEKGQSKSLNLSGGATTTEFNLQPTQYEADRHFFLGYYFRNRWEKALSRPPNLQLGAFNRIGTLEVWRLDVNVSPTDDDQIRRAIAVVDLGEEKVILQQGGAYSGEKLPEPSIDQYTAAELDEKLRAGDADDPRTYLHEQKGLASQDFQVGRFQKLTPQEYDFNPQLGYLTLTRALEDNEALAVAYTYTARGRQYQVGDLVSDASSGGGARDEEALVLKLLQPPNVRVPSSELPSVPWHLEMRNIYSLPASGVDANRLDMEIEYAPPGRTATPYLPEVGGQRKLLEILGLDRLNVNGSPKPDGKIDPLAGVTIDPANGLIIFPYLEPFGRRIRETIEASDVPNADQLIDRYVFSNLYDRKISTARQDNEHDVYYVRGTVKGRQSSFYDLGAFSGLVEGSVNVTANGQQLVEGSDYVVDYTGGTVRILNPTYTSPNTNLNISYEQNSLFSFQQKTLLGARADLSWSENLTLGATLMHLSEKTQVDKYRVGEEPISNMIWGFDGAFQMESRWLTRMLDALPLVQTRMPSEVQLQGEFARLQPGRSLTSAFDHTRRQLQQQSEDFYADELQGVSYLDSFEGFENTIALDAAGSWRLSAPPDSIAAVGDGLGLDAVQERSYWRAQMGWYSINIEQVDDLLEEAPQYRYPDNSVPVYSVDVNEVYPGRDLTGLSRQQRTITTFDVYYNPRTRGQYNYTEDLASFVDHPRKTWGGITLPIPPGYNDFGVKNIEFVEFIFRPFAENPTNDAGKDAMLYLDLGTISEEVIPDGELNREDGLSLTNLSPQDTTRWGRLWGTVLSNTLTYDEETQRTEDLGYDGLASDLSFPGDPSRYQGSDGMLYTEQSLFDEFLSSLDQGARSDPLFKAEVAKAQYDPSNDDFHHYREDAFFRNADFFPAHGGRPAGATFQQRFAHFYGGQELNGFQSQNDIADNNIRQGVARYPDDEDLNKNSSVDTENSYYEYAIPLGREALKDRTETDDPEDYVVGEIQSNGQGTGWYLIRIPVRNPTRRVGEIQDFSTIESMRLWTTGHKVPVTLRFASMDLVGSRWRKAENLAAENQDTLSSGGQDTRLSIASINTEEDAGRYVKPDAVVQRQSYDMAGGAAQQLREQSMVLRVENMKPGQIRAVYKNFSDGLDLLKYSNLRMFTHLHGEFNDGRTLVELLNNAGISPQEVRNKVKLFVRLGSNETNDYYQYVQPLMPSPSSVQTTQGQSEPDDLLWRTNQTVNGELVDLNSMNIEMGALNRLKVERDRRGFPIDSSFYHSQVKGLQKDVTRFAPSGTRLSIRGNPSLGRVTTMVIGLMIADDADLTSLPLKGGLRSVEMWINELRVSGYDQQAGWAGQASANIQFADLGYIRTNVFNQTAGFGPLSSTLGSREQMHRLTWGVDARLNLDQLLPERYGWKIPIQVRFNTSNNAPIFAPSRGDVRVDDLLALVAQDSTITDPGQKAALQNEIKRAAETYSANRTVQVSVSKDNSKSALLRKTLDNLRLTFNFSDRDAHNPSSSKNDSWQWGSELEYDFEGSPFSIRPLWFLREIPLVGFIGDLAWNLMPNAVGFTGMADRSFARNQNRLQVLRNEQPLPYAFAAPVNDRHSFDHRRTIDVQYNPFNFLNLSYQSNVDQSLHTAGVDTISSIAVQDADGNLLQTYQHTTVEEALAQSLIDSTAVNQGRVTQIDSLQVLPLSRALQQAFSVRDGLRTDTYGQNMALRLTPPFSGIEALDWIKLNDVTYTTDYSWRNGPPDQLIGASLRNNSSISTGISIQPHAFWQKFDFYTNLENAAGTPDSSAGLLPSPLEILRGGFLMLTRINSISLSYQNQWNTASSAVGQAVREDDRLVDVRGGFSLFDAFSGEAPPLAYRLGLQRHLGSPYRVFGRTQVADQLQNNHSLSANTALQPITGLNVQLNWTAGWGDNQNLTYGRETSLLDSMTTNVHNGQNQVSVWSFGTSYEDLVNMQLEALQQDVQRTDSTTGSTTPVGDANRDGRIALSNPTLMQDFQKAFTRGPGAVGISGTMPFPMPSWTVTYSGASKWPILKSLTNGVTLRHGYFSSYSTNYRFDRVAASARSGVELGRYLLQPLGSELVTNSISINETFNPLIEMSVRWKGDFQTTLGWSKSNAYQINGSRQIRESLTNELSFTAGWQKQGFQLPFLSIFGRLDNTIRFNLTASLSSNLVRSFQIKAALQEAVNTDLYLYDPQDALIGEGKVTEATNTTRISVSPQVTYRFSNRVSGTMFLKYNNLRSANSLTPSMNTLNGGFTVNVSIAN